MDVNKVGLKKITLQQLEPTLFNGLIVGIIIAKQRPKQFLDQRSPDNNVYKGVFNFTLRDSPQDFINVTYWERSNIVFDAYNKFHIGDIVEVIKPQILIRKFSDHGEQFRPMVTSPYSLTLNEQSDIVKHEGNPTRYTYLLKVPTKPPGFIPIRDIHSRGISMKDEFVDILAAVRFVGNVRLVKVRDGSDVEVREVIVFDHTNPGIRITIWDPDLIQRASNWKQRTTTLFISDLKVDWSTFHKSVIAVVNNKTIITENPIGQDAEELRTYALSVPLDTPAILDQLEASIPNPHQIQNVMSIRQVHQKLNSGEGATHGIQFTALLFVIVTKLDLDGPFSVILKKCAYCRSMVKTSTRCDNSDCPVARGGKNDNYEISFDIQMMVSDQTGSLPYCRLSGKVAEEMLNCSVQEFVRMTDEEKSNLKWRYLLSRCAVRIAAFNVNNKKPVISILTCSLADSLEVARRIPIY